MIVRLLYKYLGYDIKNLAYRYSRARYLDKPELNFESTLADEDFDENIIRRYCLTGIAKMRLLLREYLVANTADADDTLGTEPSWQFKFKADEYDGKGLADVMHWFVVKLALLQWVEAYSPDDAAIARRELDSAEADLKKFLIDSPMPMKERRECYDNSDHLCDCMIDEIVVTYGE